MKKGQIASNFYRPPAAAASFSGWWWYVIVYYVHAQIRMFARSQCFPARNGSSFPRGPHEVCEGLLPQIIVKRAMKQISCRTRGEGHT